MQHRQAAYTSGWLLKRGWDPATNPVWLQPSHLPSGWYLLDEEGCFEWVDWVTMSLPKVPDELPPWARGVLIG